MQYKFIQRNAAQRSAAQHNTNTTNVADSDFGTVSELHLDTIQSAIGGRMAQA